MTKTLCLTLRFLDPVPQFHGRNDTGDPEWPPSPLRLFQAMVCAAAKRWSGGLLVESASAGLCSLESHLPVIVTPKIANSSFGYRMYVPNNSGDLMTAAWSRGDTATTMAEYRVEKDVRPINLNGDSIHFLFPFSADGGPSFETIQAIARSITHLGWGIDMVAGNAVLLDDDAVSKLEGDVWHPTMGGGGTPLRVPVNGTFDALVSKHAAFLKRIGPDGFRPVPPLSAFQIVGYQQVKDFAQRRYVAFSILKPDISGMRSFDPLRRTRDVAGLVRHAAAESAHAQGWRVEKVNEFIHGKQPNGERPPSGPVSPDRFQYLPLPTINPALNRIESIRRVLVVAPPHCGTQIDWARRNLSGSELIHHDEVMGVLTLLPGSDWVLKQYLDESCSWSTVTPVILPGFDDPDHLRKKLKQGCDASTQKRYLSRLELRTEDLLRKAFRQAGFSDELMRNANVQWRDVGFRPGAEMASRYLPPENLTNSPRYHVRVTFPEPIRGPIAVGSGRFRGFGLFAKMSD